MADRERRLPELAAQLALDHLGRTHARTIVDHQCLFHLADWHGGKTELPLVGNPRIARERIRQGLCCGDEVTRRGHWIFALRHQFASIASSCVLTSCWKCMGQAANSAPCSVLDLPHCNVSI